MRQGIYAALMATAKWKDKPADESLKIKTKHASKKPIACTGVSRETYPKLGSCAYEQRRNFMKLNRNTKKAQAFINRYDVSIDEYLSDVYDNPSHAKVEAFNSCYRKMLKMHGSFLRIISYNAFTFTVGYVYLDDNKVMLNIETAYNSYQIEY